jgi:hypothetical protein
MVPKDHTSRATPTTLGVIVFFILPKIQKRNSNTHTCVIYTLQKKY